MVSDILPNLKFGDPADPRANAKQLKDGKNDRENMYYNLNEKVMQKYMFMVSIKDIKTGERINSKLQSLYLSKNWRRPANAVNFISDLI